MLHLRDEVFEHRIRHIADEQIALVVLGGQEMFIGIRGFRYHPPIFVVLGTAGQIRVFRCHTSWFQVRRFVVSGTTIRVFRCGDSWFQVRELKKPTACPEGWGKLSTA
jgi:hypothetical protein